MDITHDNVCSSMLSCFYSHLLSTGRPISSLYLTCFKICLFKCVVIFFVLATLKLCAVCKILAFIAILNVLFKLLWLIVCP